MKKIIIFIFLISFSATVYAISVSTDFNYVLPAPPKSEDPKSLYFYLSLLFQRWNILQITTVEPNVNIDADIGQGIIYNNSGTYYLAVQTTSPHGTTWVGIALGAI